MWRFKPSKFKNAVSKTSKNKEDWITDISVGSLSSFGNHIKASASLVAFNVDQEGQGNLGIAPLNDFRNKKLLYAHSGFITDFDFCPYDDYVLATASEDCYVKLWRITEKYEAPSNPVCDILLPNRIETVKFHPQADCILSLTESNVIHLWDMNTGQSIYSNAEHSSLIYSVSWKYSGEIIASCGRDRKLRIWDPREPSRSQVVNNHYSDRDSKIVWIGNSDQLITTGLGSERQREAFLRDLRKLNEPVASYSGDISLKAYIPLHDPDTNMLFLVALANHAVIFCEILDCIPYLQEAAKHVSDVQILGAAMVPKRALHLMDAEVNRLLLLGKNCVVPVSYQVPRKSYRNFHEDLFPETFAPEPSLTSNQWQNGEKVQIQKINMNPNNVESLIKSNCCLFTESKKEATNSSSDSVFSDSPEEMDFSAGQKLDQILNETVKPAIPKKPNASLKSGSHHNEMNVKLENTEDIKMFPTNQMSKGLWVSPSKFRYLNGTVFPKEYHITNLVSLTRTLPGESDGFHANLERVAIAVGAAGNFLAVLELSKPGRAPAISDMPGIETGVCIMDFSWDPFDCNRLAVACENGILQIWIIPNNLSNKLNEPYFSLSGHTEKITCVKFHPCAKDIIASASSDLQIFIWDLVSKDLKFYLTGATDQIFSFAWSPDGNHLASVSKDQKIRLYNVRQSSEAIQEGSGPEGMRGARMFWVLNGTYLAVSGFSKACERQIYVYDIENIKYYIHCIGLDASPAILIPHYDEDTATLFLSGKGDAIIYAYGVSVEHPHLHALSHYKCSNPHQAISFLPKCVCDVRKVEFARAVRLTSSAVEPISFYVPRLRMEYFQDDLFPLALKTWMPSMTSSEWIAGIDKPLERVDLKPCDMVPLSEAPPPVKVASKPSEGPVGIMFEGEVAFESSLSFLHQSKEKREKIVQSMMSQCELQETNLPQEEFEGVDPSEWDEDV